MDQHVEIVHHEQDFLWTNNLAQKDVTSLDILTIPEHPQ